jgi:hypothetical protein
MLKTIRCLIAGLIAMGLSSVAAAQGLDTKKLFFGAGLSQNEISGFDTGTGYQFFGGYGFGEVSPKLFVDAEVGYMDTGKMEHEVCLPFVGCVKAEAKAKGLWANGVGRFMVAPNVELIGRAGLDFGDDDGFMFGIGVGYLMSKNAKLRLEYVERDTVSSLQFNFVYQP